MDFKQNSEWEVLTPNGWSDFNGIKKLSKNNSIKLIFIDGGELHCSLNHKIKMNNDEFYYSKDIQIGSITSTGKIIKDIIILNEPIELYDLIGVNLNEEFYSNDVVSHNCAFISNAETIWGSIYPTLSTGGKAIILSTPNGVGGFFHKLWVDATLQKNRFHTIKLKWDLHPERGQDWRDAQDADLGPKLAAQECDVSFVSSGNSLVDPTILQFYRETFEKDPIEKRFAEMLWTWTTPNINRSYLVCADVGRGDGADFDSAHVIDLESLEQVAEFKGQMSTKEFGNMLVSLSTDYNDALLVIENASYGWAVIQQVLERQYKNLFYMANDLTYVDSNTMHSNSFYKEEKKLIPGFTTSMKTRPLIISKLESYMREKELIIHSKRLIDELDVFIWKNGKAQAMQGYNDDLVMAMAIGLWIRDTAIRLQSEQITKAKQSITGIGVRNFAAVYSNKSGANNPYQMDMGTGRKAEDISWLLNTPKKKQE